MSDLRQARTLLRIDDLSNSDVDAILERAGALADSNPGPGHPPFSLATLFLTPSMRTRVGFQVAAHRLGGSAVGVDELRVDNKMSASESLSDALRVLAGMVDVVVCRAEVDLRAEVARGLPARLVNGGDALEHPTQALIDVAAIRRFAGDHSRLHVALCGDLRMRSATSLLSLFCRRPPARLSLMPALGRDVIIPQSLQTVTRVAAPTELDSVDVLVMVGLAPGRAPRTLSAEERAPFALSAERLESLPGNAIVLSPMPVIDEISADARRDTRVRMFEQSDHAVFVRMAILEWVMQ